MTLELVQNKESYFFMILVHRVALPQVRALICTKGYSRLEASSFKFNKESVPNRTEQNYGMHVVTQTQGSFDATLSGEDLDAQNERLHMTCPALKDA